VTASALKDEDSAPKSLNILSRSNSDTSINVQLPLVRGDYFISLVSNVDVMVTIILVKESLIHLKPEQSVLMTKEHTFELYSPSKAVMLEIFSCLGDIGVEASDNYKDFESDKPYNEVVLEQSNYGGHFVITS
jgi:hypothetical protein